MPESHDPMCQVPLSYLTMLQERGDGERTHAITWRPDAVVEQLNQDGSKPSEHYAAALTAERDRAFAERDELANQIAEFEFRAGCALAQIPVEQLNKAQDVYVSQQAIDTLKADNERLTRSINETASELCEWRGKFKEAERALAGKQPEEPAPYGVKKDGTPKAKPGRKAPRRRKAA